MLKFQDPKRALMETVTKFGRERPKSRLLKETGRFSNSPIFVVGIYSGADKLGEGFGSSLKMAEYRAAEDALHRLYLTRTPSHLLQLPSSTFGPRSDIYNPGPPVDYTPGALGEAEVLYASSRRSGIIAPKQPTLDELEARKDDV
jgi:large subunit ribosomal protein L44